MKNHDLVIRALSVFLFCAMVSACGGGGGGGGGDQPASTVQDADRDGVRDASDQCQNTPAAEAVDANGCSESQKDNDIDGVSNAADQCPATPAGEAVDANGCSESQKDDDADGVSNATDQCPATPAGEAVDANGCSESQKDDDGDGVSNATDQCPATPAGEAVDANGCSDSQKDDDVDGVSNAADQCPATPAGEAVDANGCSDSQKDDDADGVSNAADQCPATPAGEAVDANGCSESQKDDDADGVSNAADQCPATPAGEAVDANGCSDSQKDDDGDGVSNAIDQCPATPAGEAVDGNGCSDSQKDDDGDGVSDASDLCPDTPVGEIVLADGCPEILPASLGWIGASPQVVRNAPSFPEEVTFRACATGNFDTVVASWFKSHMTGNSADLIEVELLNTGAPCGELPRATLYATTVVPDLEMPASTPLQGGIANYAHAKILLRDENGGNIASDNLFAPDLEFVVTDATLPDCSVEQVAPNIYWCPGVVNVVLESNDFDLPLNAFLQRITTDYFTYFEDVDFLIYDNRNRSDNRNNPFFAITKNNVNGLCRSNPGSSAQFGSAGSLQGVLMVRAFGTATNHEIGHRWSYLCDQPIGTRAGSSALFSHYNRVSFTDPMSQGSGYLDRLPNDNFKIVSPVGGYKNKRFSPLTQLLAGAITKEEVPNWFVINPSVADQYNLNDEVPLSDTIEYTVEDYENANGEVVNADGTARQNAFTIGRIIVTENVPASDLDMAYSSSQTAYTVSTSEGLNVINSGLFGKRDTSSINWAFDLELVFTDGVRRLSQRSESAAEKNAILRSADSPNGRSDVVTSVIYEPFPEHNPHQPANLLNDNTEHASGHRIELIRLRDVTTDSEQ